jgi:hypothetical protein
MDPPPASAATPEKAAMLPAGSSGWAAAEQWAQGAPQKAVLEALVTITKEDRQEEAMAFGQPYGADAMAASPNGVALIKAGLYTELGDPPVLSGAKFLYLPALDRMECLVNVEATRLAAAGQVDQGVMTVAEWMSFSRQIADRQMYQEARWGVRSMARAMERMRDIAYVDFRSGSRKLTGEQIVALLDKMKARGGYLRLERLNFPEGNRFAAEQALARVFGRNGTPGPEFGQTMHAWPARRRPLRLFAEVARWDQVAAGHANLHDTQEELRKVYGDLAGRWPLQAFDVRMDTPTDLERMDSEKFAVLSAVIPDMRPIFNDRQVLRTQAVGTGCALGALAFYYNTKSFPPQLESLRPRYVNRMEADPYNPDRARGKEPPLQYYVPIRDEKFAPGVAPHPHEINVVTGTRTSRSAWGTTSSCCTPWAPTGTRDGRTMSWPSRPRTARATCCSGRGVIADPPAADRDRRAQVARVQSGLCPKPPPSRNWSSSAPALRGGRPRFYAARAQLKPLVYVGVPKADPGPVLPGGS